MAVSVVGGYFCLRKHNQLMLRSRAIGGACGCGWTETKTRRYGDQLGMKWIRNGDEMELPQKLNESAVLRINFRACRLRPSHDSDGINSKLPSIVPSSGLGVEAGASSFHKIKSCNSFSLLFSSISRDRRSTMFAITAAMQPTMAQRTTHVVTARILRPKINFSKRTFITTTVRFSQSQQKYSKVYGTADEAVADVRSGSTILSSGFGLCGVAGTFKVLLSYFQDEQLTLFF